MLWKTIRNGLAMLAVMGLTACGGGGGGGTPVLGGSTSTTSPATLQVKFSAATVDNSGTVNNTATITALDANGKALSGVAVALSVNNNATFTTPGNTTGKTTTDGTMVANVTIGNDYSLRKITLTASSGGISSSGSFDVVGSATAASDLLLTAPAQIQNSVSNTVTVTATAVDANRNALSGIPVTFSVDSGATLVPSGTKTGDAGTLTGQLRIGADQSKRDITVRATSGTVVREIKVQVAGAALSSALSSKSVAITAPGKITYLLQDNTGAKMVGYAIVVSPSTGSTSTGVTDANGEYVYSYTAPATAQTLSVTAAAAGVSVNDLISVTGSVTVPNATLAVTSGTVAASPQSVAVSSPAEVRALFVGSNNAPVENVRVWFDLDGDKQSIGGVLASKADGLLLYSSANGIARTTYTAGTRFSPKDGVTVRICYSEANFTVPAEGASCGTDERGVAVKEARTTLTVNSESLSVTIGTNGTIETGQDNLTYIKRYVVQVVDSSGQAKSGVTISPSVDLLHYLKGEYTALSGATVWTKRSVVTNSFPSTYPSGAPVVVPSDAPSPIVVTDSAWCANEDFNRNGVVENYFDAVEGALTSEDVNGSASLSPPRPALDPRKADVSITMVGGSVTNADGVAVLKIEYPQNLASWIQFNILVSASGVAGTEGRASFKGVLPVLAAALTNVQQEPPFRYSPYGTQGSPTYFRRNADGQGGWVCTNPN